MIQLKFPDKIKPENKNIKIGKKNLFGNILRF